MLNTVKKKWYQKWWIWLIIVLAVGAIGSNLETEDNSSTDIKNTDAKPDVVKPQADKAKTTKDKKEQRTITTVGQTIETKNFKIKVVFQLMKIWWLMLRLRMVKQWMVL